MAHQENPAEEITQLAVKIASSLYGVIPRTHLFQSARSHVFRLDFGEGVASKILKIARVGNEADILREQQILPALSLRGFEVPYLEFTQQATDFDIPFSIMPFVAGSWIGDASHMPPAIAQAAYEHLGHFMARLSVLDSQNIPGGRTEEEVREQVEHSWAEGSKRLQNHVRYAARLEQLLEQGRDLGQETSGFAHWDGPQVITDGIDTFTVIDWGGAGAGHRLVDLGSFLAGHAFWALLQEREVSYLS